MTQEEHSQAEQRIIEVLKTVYDPEIPVNIYDLGLIYKIDLAMDGALDIDMTFTAPSCPAADLLFLRPRDSQDSLLVLKLPMVVGTDKRNCNADLRLGLPL